MLKTKIVSSQIKAFLDDSIDSFPTFSHGSSLLGERYSFQLLYVDEGESTLPTRPICSLKIDGALAPYTRVRDVRNLPVERPINPEKFDSQYLRIKPGLYPDILTPLRYGGKIVISHDKLRSLWIEIDIPKDFKRDGKLSFSFFLSDASAGDTGNIAFDEQPPIAVNTIEIDLIPAILPEQQTKFTQWFYPDCLASYYNL